MTKDDKIFILYSFTGIPMKVLISSSEKEIDSFIKKKNLEKFITDENLILCKANKEYMKFLRSCR